MFEQRVLQAYREKIALERQEKLIQEEEDNQRSLQLKKNSQKMKNKLKKEKRKEQMGKQTPNMQQTNQDKKQQEKQIDVKDTKIISNPSQTSAQVNPIPVNNTNNNANKNNNNNANKITTKKNKKKKKRRGNSSAAAQAAAESTAEKPFEIAEQFVFQDEEKKNAKSKKNRRNKKNKGQNQSNEQTNNTNNNTQVQPPPATSTTPPVTPAVNPPAVAPTQSTIPSSQNTPLTAQPFNVQISTTPHPPIKVSHTPIPQTNINSFQQFNNNIPQMNVPTGYENVRPNLNTQNLQSSPQIPHNLTPSNYYIPTTTSIPSNFNPNQKNQNLTNILDFSANSQQVHAANIPPSNSKLNVGQE